MPLAPARKPSERRVETRAGLPEIKDLASHPGNIGLRRRPTGWRSLTAGRQAATPSLRTAGGFVKAGFRIAPEDKGAAARATSIMIEPRRRVERIDRFARSRAEGAR